MMMPQKDSMPETNYQPDGHPTRASCTTLEDFCPIGRKASKPHEKKPHGIKKNLTECLLVRDLGTPIELDAARRQLMLTWYYYQARAQPRQSSFKAQSEQVETRARRGGLSGCWRVKVQGPVMVC